MLDITADDFQTEVVEASMHTPQLLDFWAAWCGPCKTLGPLLEQVEDEYQGRFRLLKVDADQEQQLASAFGVRSLPTCILVVGGKPINGFMGAIPKGKIEEFLDKYLPSAEQIEAQDGAAEAQALLEQGDPDGAIDALLAAVEADPANQDTRYEALRLLIATERFDEAQSLLAPVLKDYKVPLRFAAMQRWLAASTAPLDDEPVLRSRIAAQPRDFAARYALAQHALKLRDDEAALDALYEIILRDKTWSEELARKTYVEILELMAEEGRADDALQEKLNARQSGAGGANTEAKIAVVGKVASSQNPLLQSVAAYRRKLSMALN